MMRNLFVFDTSTSSAESGVAYHDQRPARPLRATGSACERLHDMSFSTYAQQPLAAPAAAYPAGFWSD
eukprot:6500934-Heterocapsa_arctica.AAC.1